MSILINGMDIPEFGEKIIILTSSGYVEDVSGQVIDGVEAVPVPPHGDLIDRAMLIDSFEPSDFWNSSAEDNCFAAIHVTNSMPTIIPAEPAEEEMK